MIIVEVASIKTIGVIDQFDPTSVLHVEGNPTLAIARAKGLAIDLRSIYLMFDLLFSRLHPLVH